MSSEITIKCGHEVLEYVCPDGDGHYLRCHDCKKLFWIFNDEFNDLEKPIIKDTLKGKI